MRNKALKSLCFLVVLASMSTFVETRVLADAEHFPGEIDVVADPAIFANTEVTIRGESAFAIFSTIAALTRIVNVGENLRMARGENITCFEHLPGFSEIELPYYTCEFVVAQGGHAIPASFDISQ